MPTPSLEKSYCSASNGKKSIEDLTLEQFQAFSSAFEKDIYDAISMESCVNRRQTLGAPGRKVMEIVINAYKEDLKQDWQDEE